MEEKAGNKPKTIRNNNLRLIIDLYREESLLSVSAISGIVNLSRTTVSKINEKLCGIGIVKACGKGDSTEEGGKKPELYCLNNEFARVASFHILEGYVNIKYFDLCLNLVEKRKTETYGDDSLENIISIISNELKSYRKLVRPGSVPPLAGISVAVHGIVDSGSGICLTAPHFPSWGSKRNIRKMITDRIGMDVPVHVESWIRFKAYSARAAVGASQYRNYVLLDAGLHGIVSGVVVNGTLLSGSHYLSGEIGHTIISATDSRQCYCGGRGCLESFVDCRRLVKRALSMREQFPGSLLFREQEVSDIFAIFEASNSSDPLACQLMEEIAHWFAIGLSNICLMFDPEVIYFEGDYSAAGPFFEEKLLEKIKSVSLINLEKDFRIIFHEPRHNATALGAAAFARDYFLFNMI